jgi:hypothetical protein
MGLSLRELGQDEVPQIVEHLTSERIELLSYRLPSEAQTEIVPMVRPNSSSVAASTARRN